MKTALRFSAGLFSLCLALAGLAEPAPVAAPAARPPPAATATAPAFVALLFAAPGCEDCEAIKRWWAEEYPALPLGIVNIERPENFAAFLKLEQQLVPDASARGDFPALMFAGTGMVQYGTKTLAERRAAVTAALRGAPGTAFAISPALVPALPASQHPIFVYDFSATATDAGSGPAAATTTAATAVQARRYLAFFSQPGCRACSRLEQELRHLESAHPEMSVDRFDVTEPRGKSALLRVAAQLQIAETAANPVPLLAWEFGYRQRLKRLPEGFPAGIPLRTTLPFWRAADTSAIDQALERVRGELKRVTWGVIVISGLIDGVNPCAFAAVVFLISYLGVLGRTRKEVLLLGASYCVGVFAAYFLIGVGLLQALRWTESHQTLKLGVSLITAAVALFLALLHARDALLFRRTGRANEMKGGLSASTVRRIHEQVRRLSGASFLVPAGLVLGAIVASLELACTGQVYFPNLVLINRSGATWHSLAQLLAYNTAFIVPLLGVTAAAAGGVSAQGLAEFARKHVVLTKLLLSLLFAGMALLILFLAWNDVPSSVVKNPG